jgi:hypothetical protein
MGLRWRKQETPDTDRPADSMNHDDENKQIQLWQTYQTKAQEIASMILYREFRESIVKDQKLASKD